jgi:3-deoxy-manno-octulosonate cytidylyltransferase (CMP-KDO synthetase)
MVSGPAPKVLAVIPARYASTRFPGKVIVPLAGKPLVQHVYERTCLASLVSEAVIATDDKRVVDALKPYGTPTMLTRADHPTGTDRIAEVAAASDADIIVNVQGDEPLIDPQTVNAAIQPLIGQADVPMATVRRLITDQEMVDDPNVVKVVCDQRGRALYFSRYPLPYVRDAAGSDLSAACHWQHIGLYVFRREFLLKYAGMAQTPLEELEKLEQLRVLENGIPIAVVDTEYASIGVDTPDDYKRVCELIEQGLEGNGNA